MAGKSIPQASLLSPAEAPESVIAGLPKLRAWSLWVPVPIPIPPASVEWLAQPNFTLVVWHVSDGGSRSPAVRARGRAFGLGSSLVATIAATVTLRIDEQELYSDVAIATRDHASIASFLSRPMASWDSAAALFSSTTPSSEIGAWASATLCLLSLWMDYSKGPIGIDDSDRLLVSFLDLSRGHQAIPIIQLDDASGGRYILAVGERSALEPIASGMQASIGATAALATQIKRGLRSPLAP